MTPDLEILGRQAVGCPAWRWMPGMVAVVPSAHNGATGHTMRLNESQIKGKLRPDLYPDLTDPATLGCLLALVREAHGEPTAFVERHPIGAPWQVHTVDGGIFAQGESEAAALVAALMAAP